MDDQKLAEYIDTQRWLMNNGLISDSVKNQLFFCGSIVHKEVQAVELDIEVETKTVKYRIYVTNSLIGKINKYKALSAATSAFGMWRFARFLKKEGSMDFQQMLNKFVVDFCGPKWSTTVEVISFDKYVEGIGEQSESPSGSQPADKQPD